MMRYTLGSFVLLSTLCTTAPFTTALFGDDWPQWLGPQRDGVWREDGVLAAFAPEGPRLRWKADIGSGYSGPAVAAGRVFVMDRVARGSLHEGKLLHDGSAPANPNFLRRLLPGTERIVCLDESTGETQWIHEYDCPYTTTARYAIGPRVTPTVDQQRVYTLGSEGNLFCLSVEDGDVQWSKEFKTEYGWEAPEWGAAAHPLVDQDKLICVVGGQGTTVVAFDKVTGEERWRALSSERPGYCPPVVYEIGGRRQLIIWHGEAVNGLDPETGQLLWSAPIESTFGMSIGMPRLFERSLFMTSFNRKSAVVRIADDFQSAEITWLGGPKTGIGGVLDTAAIDGEHVFGCGPDGRYTCARLSDGKQIWTSYEPTTGKRPGAWANAFTIKHGDRYFLANDIGELIIARLTPQGYDEISRAQLIKPTHDIGNRTVVWSHPAFANRSIYLRNDGEIRCYSLAEKAGGVPTCPPN